MMVEHGQKQGDEIGGYWKDLVKRPRVWRPGASSELLRSGWALNVLGGRANKISEYIIGYKKEKIKNDFKIFGLS